MNRTDKLKPYPGWPADHALSRPAGIAAQAKDFDWLAKSIPCQVACPAGTDIPGYLEAVARGDYEAAYRINLADNVFPSVLGRVCTRPCEPACRHGWEGLGDPVAICFSKRSAADFLRSEEPIVLERVFDDSGKSVAVIGAGAAGLAVSRQLALYGHRVKVYERHRLPGGMMVQGIPHFRLPREVVQREIDQVARTGVEILCGVAVGTDISLQQLVDDHHAVVIAVGHDRPHIPDLPGVDLRGIRHGLSFLRDVNAGLSDEVGRRVVVVGGGFTAVDCARTALRLGAESVDVCYRRSAEEMYITAGEVEEMQREGIGFATLSSPLEFAGDLGHVAAVRFTRTQLGRPDASGRRRPEPIPGSEFEAPADMVLLATGQQRQISWMEEAIRGRLFADDETLRSGPSSETAIAKLFIAGDYALGATTLIDAIGHGKACARRIDAFLMGKERLVDVALIEDVEGASTGRTRAMDEIPRQVMPSRPLDRRGLREEVDTGFDRDTSATEASRCYLCGFKYEIDNDLCIYCDRCLKVKPVDGCIVKASSLVHDVEGRITGYRPSTSNQDYSMLYIDQKECIRCGACADVCPVDCIPLQRVSKKVVRASQL